MARIEPLPLAEWPKTMRAALAAMVPPEPRYPQPVQENRPAARNILGTFAHHPALARAFFTFNGHILRATTLTERQREMIVLRVAAVRTSNYEWAQHLCMAHDAGLTDEEIARIAFGPEAPFWSDLDAALLQAVDDLISDGAIGQNTWDRLRADFDTQQILDILFTVTAYDGLARMSRSFELDLDDDLRPAPSDSSAAPTTT